MKERKEFFAGGSPLKLNLDKVAGKIVSLCEEEFYKISNYPAIPPFLITLVRNDDHWMYIPSYGD